VFRAAGRPGLCSPIGEVLPSEYHGKVSMAVRRADGRVTVISPWNFPAHPDRPAALLFPLVAGNTIVLKPSEDTPYIRRHLLRRGVRGRRLARRAFFNVVTCSRDNIVGEIGDELIENPLVKGISFTGSTAVGRMIAAKAGAHLKKCCVELGGKDSLIVCDDADLEKAAQPRISAPSCTRARSA
jgi:acyl-CoA reductase-like NAD-dependent aldehyde dehydrogenase